MKVSVVERDNMGLFSSLILNQANVLCKKMISMSYIKNHTVKNADALVIAHSGAVTRSKNAMEVRGIAFLQVRQNSVYIDVICASGVGSMLLEETFNYAKSKGKQYVTLSALSHVIGYYRKFGFVHGHETCVENKNVNSYYKNPTSPVSPLNKEYRRLLQLLVQKRFVSNPGCKTVDDCSLDGFIMTRCL
jgi:N-acetylglutamate synthase-like GNAT family acetyltransferase